MDVPDCRSESASFLPNKSGYNMKRIILLLAVFCLPFSSFAGDIEAPAAIKKSLTDMLGEAELAKMAFRKSPLPNIYEVAVQGDVFYIDATGRYIIYEGNLLDLKDDAKNLTASRKKELRNGLVAELDEKDMVVFAPKDTKHTLTVFTDVDCGYCVKLHQEVQKLNAAGIKVRYMAFPRSGIGSPTYTTMVSVWCAQDKQQAMNDAKASKKIQTASCKHPIQEQYQLGQQLGVRGTPALLMPDGELLPGYAPADKLIQYMNQESKDS
ncbi:MAG: DsbC family protein [Pseudomonadota bacterium]